MRTVRAAGPTRGIFAGQFRVTRGYKAWVAAMARALHALQARSAAEARTASESVARMRPFYYDRRVLHFLDVGARRELVGLEVGVFYGSGARYECTRPYSCVLSSFSEGTRPGGFSSHLDRLSLQDVGLTARFA